MRSPRDISIVLGPSPTRLNPIQPDQLEALAARRKDVALRTADSGARGKRYFVVFDPTGRVPGELLFIDGRLQIREPAKATLEWMLELADELGARLRDNALRTDKTADETYRHPDDQAAVIRLRAAIRKSRKLDRTLQRPRRGALRTAMLVGAAAAVALSAWIGNPTPLLSEDRELGHLLQGMALIKAAIVLAALGLLWWRFKHPVMTPLVAVYLFATWLAAAASILIWQLTAISLAAISFHVGGLAFLLAAWRDWQTSADVRAAWPFRRQRR